MCIRDSISTDQTQETCPTTVDHTVYTALTWQHELDHTYQEYICPERSRSTGGNRSYRSYRSSVPSCESFAKSTCQHLGQRGPLASFASVSKYGTSKYQLTDKPFAFPPRIPRTVCDPLSSCDERVALFGLEGKNRSDFRGLSRILGDAHRDQYVRERCPSRVRG